MKFLMVLVSIIILGASVSYGGNEGKGGDKCQARIEEIRNDISDWIQAGVRSADIGSEPVGSALLDFRKTSITFVEYSQMMQKEIALTRINNQSSISCTDDPTEVTVGGIHKTCKVYGPTNNQKMLCFRGLYLDGKPVNGFMGSSEDEQYFQIHHEFAVLSGIEDQSGQDSNYPLSEQVVGRSGYRGFLINRVVKKLSVLQSPQHSRNSSEYDCRKSKYDSVSYYKITIDPQVLESTQVMAAISDVETMFRQAKGPFVDGNGIVTITADYSFNGPWNWNYLFHMGTQIRKSIDTLIAKYPGGISVNCQK